jgi:chromosome segregation ATPase
LKELDQKEEIIYAFLEAQTVKLQGGKKQGGEVKSELEYKKNLVKKSASTLDEAKVQYDNLLVKTKRLGDLESTLKEETKNYQEKIERSKMEITDKFDRVDFQRTFYKNENSKMQELLGFLEKNKNSYKTLLESTKYKAKSKSSQLEDLETYKRLHEMEKKMQENENYIYSLITYIDSKEKESDYSQIMQECLDVQQEINSEIIKRTLSVKI